MNASIPGYWHWVALATLMLWALVLRMRVSWRTHLAVALAIAWATALFSWSVTLDPAVGSVSGHVASAKSHQPLVGARVYRPDGDAWTRTNANGDFHLPGVPVGKDERITVRVLGYETSYSEVAVTEAHDTSGVLFRMTPRRPTFYIYNSTRVFTPRQKPVIQINGDLINNLDIAVYRLDPRTDRAGVVDASRRTKLAARVTRNQNSIRELHYEPTLDPDGDFADSVTLPDRLSPGLYLVTASQDGGPLVRTAWFLVTDLAVVTRRSPHELLVYAQRFSTGTPAAGVRVDLLGADGAVVREGVTGRDGTWLWKKPAPQRFQLLANQNDMYAYCTVDAAYDVDTQQPAEVYLFTDRPIYRPGQQVFVKGIVRLNHDRVLSIPTGPVSVALQDSQGATLEKTVVPCSAFGGFACQFKLPAHGSLGSYAVLATFGRLVQNASFQVADYRKPEYRVDLTPEKSRYTSGNRVRVRINARYFVGSPVANAKVHWSAFESYAHFDTVQFQPLGDDEAPEHYGGLTAEGDLRLDANGSGLVTFKPDPADHDRTYWVQASVEDASRRTVTSSTDVLVTVGNYYLETRTDAFGYRPGQKVTVTVTAHGYDSDLGRPATLLHGKLVRVNYVEVTHHGVSHYEQQAETIWSRDGVTDDKGRQTWVLQPPTDGTYRFEVTSRDTRGQTVSDRVWFFVSGGADKSQVFTGRDLQVLLDRPKYAPGSKARVVITTGPNNPYVLLCIDGRRILHYEIVHVHGHAASVTIPVKPEYFPDVIVTAILIHDQQLLTDTRTLKVDTRDLGLKVSITPDRDAYEPGQTVNCQVHVTDANGRPVVAEFSLGVVDSAVYALAPDYTQNIYDFFHGPEPGYVQTEYSFSPDYSGGRNKEDDPRVRRNFKDTAFWSPLAVTGPDGTANLSFTLPDNLTTWRFTVRAITKGSRAGQATRDVVSRKPLLVRLEVPRFMVVHDRMEMSAVVNNDTSTPQDVRSRLEVKGLKLLDAPDQQFIVAAHRSHRFVWGVRADKAGTATVSVTSRGQGVGDAMELAFPVLVHGVTNLVTSAGQVEARDGSWRVTVPPHCSPRLTVYLTPSLADVALQGLDDLASTPGGCVEQTMSAILPDIALIRARQTTHQDDPATSRRLSDLVNQGLARLYDSQHDDGGWGWWKDDRTQPYLTAYVVSGLWRARAAGFDVRDDVYRRAVDALRKLAYTDVGEFQDASGEVRQQTMWSVKACEVHVLAEVDPPGSTFADRDRTLALAVENHLATLNPYTRALLAEALYTHGARKRATALLKSLYSSADKTPTTCHWDTKTVSYSWVDDPVEATAAVLRVMLVIDPQSPLIDSVVRWLVTYRRGTSWNNTRDTAAAVDALLDVMVARHEETVLPFDAEVLVNGQRVARVHMQDPMPARAGAVEVPAKLLHTGANEVTVRRVGASKGTSHLPSLYWSGTLYTVNPVENYPGDDEGFSVTRSYALLKTTRDKKGRLVTVATPLADGQAVPVGAEVRVTVSVKTKKPYPYVMIEDRLIPGCDLTQAEADRNVNGGWWVGREVSDDSLTVYVTRLDAGEHRLVYDVRAEAAGHYHVRPAEARLMYTPEVRGHSPESHLTIRDAQP